MGYNLLFLNVHGLKPEKLASIVSLLDHHHCDIVCICESWFDWRVPDLFEHPYLVCHSNAFRLPPKPNFHLPGGCALFARPPDHSQICAQPLNDAIRWTYQGRSGAVVYFPPSLHPEDIPAYMSACGEIDLWLAMSTLLWA